MMRGRERDEVLEAPDIPLDLQFEILKRLPVKSLARFKCVSKIWSSLIRSKGYFFPSSPPRLYIQAPLMNKQVPPKYALLSLASTAFDLDLDRMIDGNKGYPIASLRGLILYELLCGQVCIYNPTTGQSVALPPSLPPCLDMFDLSPERVYMHDYYFGYDPVLDQYKVLYTGVVWPQGRYTHNLVFVLETGSSWKKLEFDHLYFSMRQGLWINGLCINGVIYYLAREVYGDDNIISFDVRSEEFNTIQVPHAMSERLMPDYNVGFIEYGGKPTLFDLRHQSDQSGLLNLWILENAGKWSKKSLVLQACHMQFFPDNICFQVIGTTQNGEVVFNPKMISNYYILYYDLHKNVVRRIDIRGISERLLVELALMEGESIMHLTI